MAVARTFSAVVNPDGSGAGDGLTMLTRGCGNAVGAMLVFCGCDVPPMSTYLSITNVHKHLKMIEEPVYQRKNQSFQKLGEFQERLKFFNQIFEQKIIV